jgi:hypothetical protein
MQANMIVSHGEAQPALKEFTHKESISPYLLIAGDAYDCLRFMPTNSIDVVITSPPYWNQREYLDSNALGGEATTGDYITSLLRIFSEVKRVLKSTGSFWLNLGDVYRDKNLCGIPWRVALALQDKQQWILRNSIVWNKLKGNPDNSKDKLRNTHEYVFHFVKEKNTTTTLMPCATLLDHPSSVMVLLSQLLVLQGLITGDRFSVAQNFQMKKKQMLYRHLNLPCKRLQVEKYLTSGW